MVESGEPMVVIQLLYIRAHRNYSQSAHKHTVSDYAESPWILINTT